MMRDMQTGQPVIVLRLQRGLHVAASAAVGLVAVAMISAFVYALGSMLHGTLAGYLVASGLTVVLVVLATAVTLSHVIGNA